MVRPSLAVLVASAAFAALVASVSLAAQARPADDNAFPSTKAYGRATIQFRDEKVHMVAVYDYSQRNHDGAWIILQAGVAVSQRTTVQRENFQIVMPGGRVVPLPTQEQFLDDSARITQLRQNARIFRRPIETYFPQSRQTDALRFFALPGDPIVRTAAFLLEEHAVAYGDLYFRSPTLRWEDGTYRLVFAHEKGRAELPIRLE